MLQFFTVPVFQGGRGIFNYKSNLSSSEDGTLVPPPKLGDLWFRLCTTVTIRRLFRLFLQRGAGVCCEQAACACFGCHLKLTLLLTFLKLSRKSLYCRVRTLRYITVKHVIYNVLYCLHNS
jgi:hypothetical protein